MPISGSEPASSSASARLRWRPGRLRRRNHLVFTWRHRGGSLLDRRRSSRRHAPRREPADYLAAPVQSGTTAAAGLDASHANCCELSRPNAYWGGSGAMPGRAPRPRPADLHVPPLRGAHGALLAARDAVAGPLRRRDVVALLPRPPSWRADALLAVLADPARPYACRNMRVSYGSARSAQTFERFRECTGHTIVELY